MGDKIIHDEVRYEAAIRRNIINNANKTFLKDDHNRKAIEWITANAHWSSFANSLLENYYHYGKLTPNQCRAVHKAIARGEERKAARQEIRERENAGSNFVGSLKERRVFNLKVDKIIELPAFQVAYGVYTKNSIYLMKDDDGNVVTYKGQNHLADEGQTVSVKATIKDHVTFRGVKQTAINRPKVEL